MSVNDEINRLSTAKTDIASAITSKGVDVPGDASISDYAALVSAIPQEASDITVDSTPTEGSQNAVSSDGVYKAIQALRKEILEEVLGNLKFRKSTTEPNVSTGENVITFVK